MDVAHAEAVASDSSPREKINSTAVEEGTPLKLNPPETARDAPDKPPTPQYPPNANAQAVVPSESPVKSVKDEAESQSSPCEIAAPPPPSTSPSLVECRPPPQAESPPAKRSRIESPIRGLLPQPAAAVPPPLVPSTATLALFPIPPPPPLKIRSNRIYIGNLDYSLGENEIRQVFGVFGPIGAVDMPREGDRSKGYCFIEFALQESAELALHAMANFMLKGRTVRAGWPTSATAAAAAVAAGGSIAPSSSGIPPLAQPASAATATNTALPAAVLEQRRIYVGNVPYDFIADDLRRIFEVFGTIANVHLVPTPENPLNHRGYGFVEFTHMNEAKLAIEIMNGFYVGGKMLRVNYATQSRTGPTTGGASSTGVTGGSAAASVAAAAAAAAAAVTRHRQQLGAFGF